MNETVTKYGHSCNTYYDKDSITNATFDRLVLAEKNIDLQANNTIDDYNSVISAYEAIGRI